jgi:hypothetical protein
MSEKGSFLPSLIMESSKRTLKRPRKSKWGQAIVMGYRSEFSPIWMIWPWDGQPSSPPQKRRTRITAGKPSTKTAGKPSIYLQLPWKPILVSQCVWEFYNNMLRGQIFADCCPKPLAIALRVMLPKSSLVLMNISHLPCGPVGVRFIESRFAGRHKCRPYKDLKKKFLFYQVTNLEQPHCVNCIWATACLILTNDMTDIDRRVRLAAFNWLAGQIRQIWLSWCLLWRCRGMTLFPLDIPYAL